MQRKVVLYKLQFGKLCFSKKKKNKIKIKKTVGVIRPSKKFGNFNFHPVTN